jgi:hypothetical protein
VTLRDSVPKRLARRADPSDHFCKPKANIVPSKTWPTTRAGSTRHASPGKKGRRQGESNIRKFEDGQRDLMDRWDDVYGRRCACPKVAVETVGLVVVVRD